MLSGMNATQITAPAGLTIVAVYSTFKEALSAGSYMRRCGRVVFLVRARDQDVQGFVGMSGRMAALYEINPTKG